MAVMFYFRSLIGGLYFTKTVWPEADVGGRSSQKKRLVITFILAATGFLIAYTPTAAFYTVFASGEQMDFHLSYALSNVVDCMFAVSVCFNPILYALKIKEIMNLLPIMASFFFVDFKHVPQ